VTYLRWLIIVVIFYLIYRVLKGLVMPRTSFEDQFARPGPEEAGESETSYDLVQDPHCGTYLPKAEAIPFTMNGQTLYFCSQECKDKFLETQKQN